MSDGCHFRELGHREIPWEKEFLVEKLIEIKGL
jgi:hypothetical protein